MILQVPWAALWTAAAAATAGDEPGGAAQQQQQQQTPSGKELKQRWKRLVKRQVCRDHDVASCGVCRWCWADQQPAGQFQPLRTERVLVGSQQASKAATYEDSRRRPSSILLRRRHRRTAGSAFRSAVNRRRSLRSRRGLHLRMPPRLLTFLWRRRRRRRQSLRMGCTMHTRTALTPTAAAHTAAAVTRMGRRSRAQQMALPRAARQMAQRRQRRTQAAARWQRRRAGGEPARLRWRSSRRLPRTCCGC